MGLITRRTALIGLGSAVAAPFGSSPGEAGVGIVPEANQFQLGTGVSNYYQPGTRIAVRKNGSFVATWLEVRDNKRLGFAQPFSATGVPLASRVRISNAEVDSIAPIAGNETRSLVVLSALSNRDGRLYGEIFGQRLEGNCALSGRAAAIQRDSPPLRESYEGVHACRLKDGNVLAVFDMYFTGGTLLGAAVSIHGAVVNPFSHVIGRNGSVFPLSVVPLSNGGAAIACAAAPSFPDPHVVHIQLVDRWGEVTRPPIVLRDPGLLERGSLFHDKIRMVGLPANRFMVLWLKGAYLNWRIFSSEGKAIGQGRLIVGAEYFQNGALAVGAGGDGQVLAAIYLRRGTVFNPKYVIATWLISPTGVVLAGPVDIAEGFGAECVVSLGQRRFIVAYRDHTSGKGAARILRAIGN